MSKPKGKPSLFGQPTGVGNGYYLLFVPVPPAPAPPVPPPPPPPVYPAIITQNMSGLTTYDEFGPIVHEIRQFDVEFDPAPVLHSRLYSSNDLKSACVEYRSTPFGAQFVIANVARQDVILAGDDKSSGSDTSVNQVCTVIGRAIVDGKEATVEVKNENAMRIRGNIEAEVTNDWLQTEIAAQQLAAWISQHWSNGIDEQEVEIFGNPLIENGDVVQVYYPARKVNNVKYFVTGIETKFESGITTTLTLRRVNAIDALKIGSETPALSVTSTTSIVKT